MTNRDADLMPTGTPRVRLMAGLGLIIAFLLTTSLLPTGAARALPSVLIPSSGAHFGARVEPRSGESQQDAVLRAEAQVGRRFAIDHYYYQWTSNFPGASQTWTVGQGRIPFINWKGSGSWSSIANGSQDAVIRARADAFREWGSPAYLTFHHEPENDLSRYGSATDYAAAFRRIVDVFRSRGVTNVAFAWTLMAWTFNPRSGRDANPYYPGDGYVDVVGADGYNWYPGKPGTQWTSFQDIFTDVNAFSVAHGKPWMVVEYGVLEDPAQPGRKGQWFRDALATARTWPALKGLLYFDVDKEYDWASDSSSSALSGYRALANDPWMQGSGAPPPSPSPSPTWSPSPSPSPSPRPSPSPSPSPTWPPSPRPSPSPSPSPTWSPSPSPSPSPSVSPPPSVPTHVVANSLNGGSVRSTITTGNSGGTSGSAFDDIDLDTGAALAYDDTHTYGPGLSARHAAGPRQNTFYQWDRSLPASPALYGRVYVWFDQLPVGDLRLIRGMDGSGLSFAIDLLRSGKLRIKDRANGTIGQTSGAITTRGWVRIEWRVDLAAGQIEVRLFNSPTSSVPTTFALTPTGRSISGSTNQMQVGRSGTQPFSVVFWTDEPAVGVTDWLGPAA